MDKTNTKGNEMSNRLSIAKGIHNAELNHDRHGWIVSFSSDTVGMTWPPILRLATKVEAIEAANSRLGKLHSETEERRAQYEAQRAFSAQWRTDREEVGPRG